MKKRLFKGIALSLALCTTFAVGVSASSLLEPISAFLNHGLVVEYNDVDQVMVDANGTKVVPITYNGSTYLPVRAVADMLGVQVGWDQATQTVLLGNSYPDVVAPVTPPTPATPLPPANNSNVPTVVNSTQLDISFIFDIVNRIAPNKLKINDFAVNNGDIVGTVLHGTQYGTGSDLAYAFHGFDFEPINENKLPEIDLIEKEIANALIANGYTFVEKDYLGVQHYVNANGVEFKIWDILEDNSSLSIEVDTRWLSCHADR